MKKNVRIFLSVVLAVMLTVCVAVTAFAGEATVAAKIGGTEYASLSEAIGAAADGATITVMNGTHTLSGSISKDLTFQGQSTDAIIDLGTNENSASGKNLVFEGLTLKRPTNLSYKGFTHSASETYIDCVIEGQYWIYGVTASFTGCTFHTTDPNNYNIWCYGSSTVNFTGCIFNCAGKSVLVYNEGYIDAASVNVTNCTFNASASAEGKAAIEIDSSLGPAYTLNITNSTAAGFDSGSVSGNSLWNNKKGKYAKIYVEGELVQDFLYAAQVGDDKYFDLQEALDAAAERGEDHVTVKLLNDVTTSKALVTSGLTATLDLDGHTLTLGAGDNKFKDATDLTIENGTINIDGLVCNGNAIICLDEYGTETTTLTLNHVHVEGKEYSSAYGVFYVGKTSVLNVNGGTMELETELFSAGGVFKADASTSKLNIDGAALNLIDPGRGVTAMDTVITNSTVHIIGTTENGLEHGFNNCESLTITDSRVTVSGGTGRGITLGRVNPSTVTINGNSVVKISDMDEGAVVFRSEAGGDSVLNIADTALLLLDEQILNTAQGTVHLSETGDLCEEHSITAVAAKDSTCTAAGNIAHYTCAACGRLYSDAAGDTQIAAQDTVVKRKDHTYGAGVQTTAPTYTKTGVMTYTCTAAGCGHTKTETIPMLIQVEDETAHISEDAVNAAITEAAGADVVLDLSKLAVVSARLPVASLRKVAELDGEATLTVAMKEATVTMDAATLKAVTGQAEGSTVTLVVERIPVTGLNQTQQAAVKGKEVITAISARIICDATGNTIRDFKGGNVTVQIPFTPEKGSKGGDYAVYYVADDGTVEKIETKYADGHLVVTLEHLNDYVIVNTKANADPANPGTGDRMAPMAALLVISTLGAAAVVAGRKRFF